jgi:hypothetical protein
MMYRDEALIVTLVGFDEGEGHAGRLSERRRRPRASP